MSLIVALAGGRRVVIATDLRSVCSDDGTIDGDDFAKLLPCGKMSALVFCGWRQPPETSCTASMGWST